MELAEALDFLFTDFAVETYGRMSGAARRPSRIYTFPILSPYKAREMAKIANFGQKAANRSVWAGLVPL